MAWIFFSLASGLVQSSVNIIDKFVVSKLVKSPIVQLLFFGIISIIIAAVVLLIRGFTPIPTTYLILSLLSGVFYAGMNLYYFKAMIEGDVSSVIPLLKLNGLFVAILAAVFLSEAFTPIKYLAVVLLLGGSLLINYSKSKPLELSKAALFMLLAAVFLAINQVMSKFILTQVDYWTLFGWARVGSFIVVLPFFYLYWDDFKAVLKVQGKKAVSLMSLSELLNLTAVLLLTIATASGFVTMTNALSMLQPLFVLLWATILSINFPQILREEISGAKILQKTIAIVIMVIGAVLII